MHLQYVLRYQHEIKCETDGRATLAAYLALSLFVGPRCHSITAFFAAAIFVMLSMCSVRVRPVSRPSSVASAISYFRPIQKRRVVPSRSFPPFLPLKSKGLPERRRHSLANRRRRRRVKREREREGGGRSIQAKMENTTFKGNALSRHEEWEGGWGEDRGAVRSASVLRTQNKTCYATGWVAAER